MFLITVRRLAVCNRTCQKQLFLKKANELADALQKIQLETEKFSQSANIVSFLRFHFLITKKMWVLLRLEHTKEGVLAFPFFGQLLCKNRAIVQWQ